MAERLSVLEICAGDGGQSYGLESAGFAHSAAVEIEPIACQTLTLNRPEWHVICGNGSREVRELLSTTVSRGDATKDCAGSGQ